MAALAWARDCVEGPHELTVARVIRFHAPAHAELRARESRDHEAVVEKRRARDRQAFLPPLRLNRPRDDARRLIERNELAVELPREDVACAHSHSAIRPTAAHGLVGGIEVRFVAPENRAGRDVDRKHVVRAGRYVNDAVNDERLRLTGVLRRNAGTLEPCLPDALQAGDVVAIDRGQRRVTLVVPIAAIRRPRADGRRDERSFVMRLRCGVQRNARKKRCERQNRGRVPISHSRKWVSETDVYLRHALIAVALAIAKSVPDPITGAATSWRRRRSRRGSAPASTPR